MGNEQEVHDVDDELLKQVDINEDQFRELQSIRLSLKFSLVAMYFFLSIFMGLTVLLLLAFFNSQSTFFSSIGIPKEYIGLFVLLCIFGSIFVTNSIRKIVLQNSELRLVTKQQKNAIEFAYKVLNISPNGEVV